MQRRGITPRAAQLAFAGDLPQGAGLSSSASLCVAAALAFSQDLDAGRVEVARMAQQAETQFVGTACGIMDQLASACGETDRALLIDCRLPDVTAIPFPEDWTALIVHSGIRRGLAESAYNERRAQCEAAARHYGVPALRDLDMKTLEAQRGGLERHCLSPGSARGERE